MAREPTRRLLPSGPGSVARDVALVGCGAVLGVITALVTSRLEGLLAMFGVPIGFAVGAGGSGFLAAYVAGARVWWSLAICHGPPILVGYALTEVWGPDAILVPGIVVWVFGVLLAVECGRGISRGRAT